jgi:putative membrane protein
MPSTPLDVESQADPLPAVKTARSARYPIALLVAFSVWWLVLAIAPWYQQDWLLENMLVFIAIPCLPGYRRLRLSNFAYTLLFVFLVLHEVGAHYTYSEVPYDDWVRGLERKHRERRLAWGVTTMTGSAFRTDCW